MEDWQRKVQVVGRNATKAISVTPNDATALTGGATNGLYVGVTGDVVVTMVGGGDVTFKSLAQGTIHLISCTKVKATGTTATSILAIY